MLIEKEYECCHEAGHAVARIAIGDTLLKVFVDPNASGLGERGCTTSKAKEIECDCDGYIRNRKTTPDDPVSRCSLNPSCPACVDTLKNRLTAIFAGQLATEYYMPRSHRRIDAQFDQRDIDQEFSYFPIDPVRRRTIEKAAKVRARALVVQEARAILAVAQAISENDGALGGPEATEIIRKNLSGNPFYLSV